MRNSLGQRPAEVSMDINTADVLMEYEKSLSESIASLEEESPATDKYAGRTPFRNGDVLLHNARADVVFRLLQKTLTLPDMRGSAFAEMLASNAAPQRQTPKKGYPRDARDAGRSRAPFAQL